MNGVLSTALRFYVHSRVQRWFFVLALTSLAARLLVFRIPCDCNSLTSILYLVLLMPAISFASLSLMVSAGLFRSISSLRTVYLIPHARAQLILALLLAQMLVASLVTLLVVMLARAHVGAPAWGSPRGTFELSFGIATLAAVALQVIAGPSRIASVLAGGLLLAVLGRADILLQPQIAGVPTADLLASAALVAWGGFAAWYLAVGPITPAAAVWTRAPAVPSRPGTAPVAKTREAALDTYLLGQPSLWLICRTQLLRWSFFLVPYAVLELSPGLLFHARHAPPPNFTGLVVNWVFIIPVLCNNIGGLIARNSRSLWLRGDESRAALFARGERLSWRALACFGLPLSLIAALAWSLLPHAMFAAAYLVALIVALVPCGIYCGLLNFGGTSDLRFLALYLIVGLGSFFAAVWSSAPSPEAIDGVRLAYWAIPPGLGLFAVAIRGFALRRWLTVDWLRYRAPRTARSRSCDE